MSHIAQGSVVVSGEGDNFFEGGPKFPPTHCLEQHHSLQQSGIIVAAAALQHCSSSSSSRSSNGIVTPGARAGTLLSIAS